MTVLKSSPYRDKLKKMLDESKIGGGEMMGTVFQEVLQKGEAIGLKKGEEKKSLRVALNCLIKGMDVQTIAEITDLPVERIELLKSAVQHENAE